jgi:DNA-binding transcriptional MocR family regulator
VRIAFAHPPAEQLEDGVRRLASVLRAVRRQQRQQQQQVTD